ncbi:MAG: hypothetical protein NTV12_07285 [Verrucomicrobia bacterium]|nr:hypothetical protein [Verrucomicrobiota bacterium]
MLEESIANKNIRTLKPIAHKMSAEKKPNVKKLIMLANMNRGEYERKRERQQEVSRFAGIASAGSRSARGRSGGTLAGAPLSREACSKHASRSQTGIQRPRTSKRREECREIICLEEAASHEDEHNAHR